MAAIWWWFRSNNAGETASGPLSALTRTVHNIVDQKSSGPTEEEQEQERQRRKALAEESLRLSNERQAARQRAIDEYERQRRELAQQIDGLERSNTHGTNNTAIENLVRQRSSLSLPQ